MSITPPPSAEALVRSGPYYLSPFDPSAASLISTWAVNELELFWLAPRTPAPLTEQKVVEWCDTRGCPMLLCRDGLAEALGYVELNPMPGEDAHLWVGHAIIRPDCRGRGLGRLMLRMMLDHAFAVRGAERVSLVVFPANTAAIRCYESAGFRHEGEQFKHFETTNRQHRMLTMSVMRSAYALFPPI